MYCIIFWLPYCPPPIGASQYNNEALEPFDLEKVYLAQDSEGSVPSSYGHISMGLCWMEIAGSA